MADIAKVKAMVRDPEFQALPWNERHTLLAKKDPEYAALSPADQNGVMNSLKARDFWQPAAAAKEQASPAGTERMRRDFVAKEGNARTRIDDYIGSPPLRGQNKLDAVVSAVAGGQALDYMKNPPTSGNAITNLGRSLANTAYGAANMLGMPYEGLSEGAIAASFPGGKPTPEQLIELSGHDRQTAKSILAPTGLAGIQAVNDSWATMPIQSLLTVAPYVSPAVKGTLRAAGNVVDKASAPFKSRMAPDSEATMRIAAERGVKLSPADITGSRVSSLSENMLSNLPTSADMIQRFREGQLSDYAKNAVKPVTDKMGASGKTYSEVGKSAQDATTARSKTLDKLVSRKFDKARSLFPQEAVSTVDANAPWRPSSFTQPGAIPTTSTKGIVSKIMKEESEVIKPLKDTEAVSVLKELAETDSMSFDAVQRNLSRMKDIIRSNDKGHASGGKFQSNSTAGAFKRIVRQLENDVDAFAAEHGGAFETAWHEARNTARAGYELFDSRRIRQVMSAEPSQLVNHFRNKNADSVLLIKKAVGPRAFDQLRGAWVESLIKSNDKGQIRPSSLGAALDKVDEGTLRSIFNSSELKEIREVARLGQRLQGAEKVAGNPSGTGQAIITPSYYGSIGAMIASGNIPAAIATVLTPPALAKMYLSKAGRKYLTEGFKIKPDTPRASAWLREGSFLAKKGKDQRGMVGKDIDNANGGRLLPFRRESPKVEPTRVKVPEIMENNGSHWDNVSTTGEASSPGLERFRQAFMRSEMGKEYLARKASETKQK